MSYVTGPVASTASLYGQPCSTSLGYYFQCDGDTIRMSTSRTPASSSATGNTGEICWDSSYIYVCTASNTWKRCALSSF